VYRESEARGRRGRRCECGGGKPRGGEVPGAEGVHRPRLALSLGRRRHGGSRAGAQMVVLTTPLRELSTPVEEYEVTAKYQVPDGRLLTVYAVRPGFVIFKLWVRLPGDVP
jgi:hypothetical protein